MNEPEKKDHTRLIIKVTRETLPQVKDRYPFMYLERGRLEIDDSSVKWISSDGEIIRLPIATVSTLLLGPGTSVTHEAIKVLAACNCMVCWKGRVYVPGKMEVSDITNQILTSCNAALYGILTSCIVSMGYSPHIGFIHSGSPLPFVYDMADLYKESLCIDLAFKLTFDLGGKYDKYRVSTDFRQRVIDQKLLENINSDIQEMIGE